MAAWILLTGRIATNSRPDRPSSNTPMTTPTARAAKQLATTLPISVPSHASGVIGPCPIVTRRNAANASTASVNATATLNSSFTGCRYCRRSTT